MHRAPQKKKQAYDGLFANSSKQCVCFVSKNDCILTQIKLTVLNLLNFTSKVQLQANIVHGFTYPEI